MIYSAQRSCCACEFVKGGLVRTLTIDEPRFRWSIAIDHRIKKILTLLEVSGSYVEQEAFLLEVAREAGMDGWTLDRLIYWFLEELLETLKKDR